MKKTKILMFSALIAAVALSPFLATAEKSSGVPASESASADVPAAKTSTPAGWTDDFEVAKKRAEAEEKDLFIVFSGTDWCGWCVRLEKDILSAPGFFEKISEAFVPVFIDIPNDASRLSELAKTQNRPLAERYGIRGFPTVLLADVDGDVFAQTGYTSPDAAAYLKMIAELAADGKVSPRYRMRKAIANVPADAPDRAARLDALLAPQELEVQLENAERVEEILAADPDGVRGFRAKYPYFTLVLPLENRTRECFSAMQRRALDIFRGNADAAVKKDDDASRAAIAKAVSENAEALIALRDEARRLRPQFGESDFAGKRLREVDENVSALLKEFGVEGQGAVGGNAPAAASSEEKK